MADFYAKHFGFLVLRDDHDRVVKLRAQESGMALLLHWQRQIRKKLLHPAAANQKEGQVLVKLVFDVEDVSGFCETARANGTWFWQDPQGRWV